MNNPEIVNQGLDSIIQESKKEIEIEVQKKESKRGRPKKDGTTEKKTVNSTNASFVSPTSQPMSKDQYKSILAGLFSMSNMYLNKYTETELFTMTKEEMEMATEMGGATLMDFMPTVNPVYINAIGFACVVGGIYGMKYQAYSDHVKKTLKEREVKK